MPDEKGFRPIKILYANDGSEHAQAALELIVNLQMPPEAEIHNVGVLIPRESSNHAVLERVLEVSENKLKQNNITVNTNIILGYPQEILIEYSNQINADLIIIGAKGLRSTLGILLGGVAQQIIEYATRPVLVVRAPYHRFDTIAIVTDGSIYSNQAVNFITGSVADPSASGCQMFPLPEDVEIKVVHVLPPVPSPELITRSWPMGTEIIPIYEPDTPAEEEWIGQHKPKGERILEQATEQLMRCDFSAEPVLLWGDAATEIIDYTRSHEINLIIAGSRGLSQMRGWFLGSVSRKLVHYSDSSVLIVKSPSLET